MKENSIEEALKKLSTGKKIKMYELLRTFKKEGIENFVITRKKYVDVILSDYKRVLKENEELKKSKITYEAVRDIQEKNRNIVDNNYISKQIVKDNLIKYQEEYELLLEHQSGKESNKTKTLRGRIHMCQELLEGRK